jgi:hypothetical protein
MTREAIDDILYDCCKFSDSTTTQTELFQVPVSGSGNGITGKTELHTNLRQQGQLPNDETFKVLGVGITLGPLVTSDADAIVNAKYFDEATRGYCELRIANKVYYRWTMSLLSQARLNVAHALTGICTYPIETPHLPMKGFIPLIRPVYIRAGNQFKVTMTWNRAHSASSTVFETYFMMLGIRFRGIQ